MTIPMAEPKVSIIIPIYNTEKYLRECLLSVQRQTMPDFEALLVNDCTPDGAMQIAREFARIDLRFRILEHEVNKGLGSARNTGIKAASGKYLNFLDSDDRLPADAIEVLLNLAESNQADMVIGNMAWINDRYLNSVSYIDRRIQFWSRQRNTNLRQLPEEVCLTGSVCNRLIKSELVNKKGGLFPEHVYYEDIPYTMAAWFHSTRVISTSRFVYFRFLRNDPNNLSLTQTFNRKAFMDRDTIAKLVFDFARTQAPTSVSAARLGRITLLNILGTSKVMLNSLDGTKMGKRVAKWIWFTLHALRINKMIKELNTLSSQMDIKTKSITHTRNAEPNY